MAEDYRVEVIGRTTAMLHKLTDIAAACVMNDKNRARVLAEDLRRMVKRLCDFLDQVQKKEEGNTDAG